MSIRPSPSVQQPVCQPWAWRCVLGMLLFLGCVGVLVWLCMDANQQGMLWLKAAVGLMGLALAAWGMRRAWRSAASGLLCWDGVAWHWQCGADVCPGRVNLWVICDAQTFMLVKWQGVDGTCWYGWVLQSEATQVWGDFRRAVYSSSHHL